MYKFKRKITQVKTKEEKKRIVQFLLLLPHQQRENPLEMIIPTDNRIWTVKILLHLL